MPSVLTLSASVRDKNSRTKALADGFLSDLKKKYSDLQITERNVGAKPPAHPDEAYTIANYMPPDQRTAEMKEALAKSDMLIDELHSHQWFVFATPMYNYSVPSTFKAWIDNVVRVGRTFKVDEHGQLKGLLEDKRALFITTRGVPGYGEGQPMHSFDHLEPYLRSIFGLMGVQDMTFVNADGLDFADAEQKVAAISLAQKKLSDLAENWQ